MDDTGTVVAGPGKADLFTDLVDGIIARDDRPLADARAEMSAAVFRLANLASAGVALTALQTEGFSRLVAAGLYDTLRLCRAMGIEVGPALEGEVDRRMAERLRLHRQRDRAGAAADRARQA